MLSELLLRLAFVAESLKFFAPVKLLNKPRSYTEKKLFVAKRAKLRSLTGKKAKYTEQRRGIRHK